MGPGRNEDCLPQVNAGMYAPSAFLSNYPSAQREDGRSTSFMSRRQQMQGSQPAGLQTANIYNEKFNLQRQRGQLRSEGRFIRHVGRSAGVSSKSSTHVAALTRRKQTEPEVPQSVSITHGDNQRAISSLLNYKAKESVSLMVKS